MSTLRPAASSTFPTKQGWAATLPYLPSLLTRSQLRSNADTLQHCPVKAGSCFSAAPVLGNFDLVLARTARLQCSAVNSIGHSYAPLTCAVQLRALQAKTPVEIIKKKKGRHCMWEGLSALSQSLRSGERVQLGNLHLNDILIARMDPETFVCLAAEGTAGKDASREDQEQEGRAPHVGGCL